MALEYQPQSQLQLARPTEARGGRCGISFARQWEAGRRRNRRQAVARVAVHTDAIYTEVFIRRPRHVEKLSGEGQTPRLAQAEFFEQAQIKIEEIWLAQTVARGDASINNSAVVVRVAVALNVIVHHRCVGQTGTRKQNRADGKAASQIYDTVEVEIVTDVLFRRPGFGFQVERIDRRFAREVAFVGIIIAVVGQRVIHAEIEKMPIVGFGRAPVKRG